MSLSVQKNIPLTSVERTSTRNKKEKQAFLLFFSRLFVPLTSVERTSTRNKKEKQAFLLFFSRLFVPLTSVERTSTRNKKEKQAFLLFFSRLFVPLQAIFLEYEKAHLIIIVISLLCINLHGSDADTRKVFCSAEESI